MILDTLISTKQFQFFKPNSAYNAYFLRTRKYLLPTSTGTGVKIYLQSPFYFCLSTSGDYFEHVCSYLLKCLWQWEIQVPIPLWGIATVLTTSRAQG